MSSKKVNTDLKEKANKVILTQTESLTMGKPFHPDLVIGGSGSGKTRSFVKPNLMYWKGIKKVCEK